MSAKGITQAAAKSDEGLGLNLVRLCSEAICTAVGKTLSESDSKLASIFRRYLNPNSTFRQADYGTKYLIPLY